MINYYNPNIKFDRKALKEVWVILNEYGEEINKIPLNYLALIEDNMDKQYEFSLEKLDTSILREDTKRIITFLYTDYLSTPEERTVLKQLEEIQYKNKLEKEKAEHAKNELEKNKSQEITNNDSIFNKNLDEKKRIPEENTKANLPIEHKESLFTNLINKIKLFMHKILNK